MIKKYIFIYSILTVLYNSVPQKGREKSNMTYWPKCNSIKLLKILKLNPCDWGEIENIK